MKWLTDYLKENQIKNGTDVNAPIREMILVILEGSLDGKMYNELVYSMYDILNKETDNSRNSYK